MCQRVYTIMCTNGVYYRTDFVVVVVAAVLFVFCKKISAL